MLVLTRKLGEEIIIRAGEHVITVSLEELSNYDARLGFDAPEEVKIYRSEIAHKFEE